MPYFQRDLGTRPPSQRKLYALYELTYTLIDVSAALLFLVGSIMFFYDSLEIPAIWCFVIGSALFAFKPILRIIREIHLASRGDFEGLAQRFNG
ncbi:hypothetical protein GGR20_001310 [Devosia subaequoris]|uniref:YrhK domain-containing protein n=1 Tax=Devosia subaequoris TaxID=395930 RepID=A0A7W6NBG8_9HYPH|nr:YrhK family protein [Devosia subaequoris]MBB4051674.1 hypothetical protein [Devosia subaequoris]MCP1209261.1 YrhK family protein [Devosia subaequoris]